MTDDEQTILKAYLLRTGKAKAPLSEAQAYALGCADVGLQKEVMATTYDSIMRNLVEVLMSDRQRRTHSQSWEYLPVGPEGPRPWPDAT